MLHTFNRNAVPALVNTQTRPKPNTKGQSRILIFTHRRFIRNLDIENTYKYNFRNSFILLHSTKTQLYLYFFSAQLHEGRGGKKEKRLQLAQLGYHSCLVNDKNVTYVT